MTAPIILYGSSVLRKQSAEVTEEDNIQEISNMLLDTLKKAESSNTNLIIWKVFYSSIK